MSLKISLDIDENKIVMELSSGNTTITKTLTAKQARNTAYMLYELAYTLDKQGNPVKDLFTVTYR